MTKLLAVFGTRPEAMKMCPLVQEFRQRGKMEIRVCVTGQHRGLLDQVMALFGITPEYDLNIMRPEQTLFDITTAVLNGLRGVLEDFRPDLVFVHGDTTTAFAASLACLYMGIPIAHVEAGLRTGDITAPFPEEFNRRAVSLAARYHFAPTEQARQNLLREGVDPDHVFLTGNTIVDAMAALGHCGEDGALATWIGDSRLILMTAHRRENLGEPMRRLFRAVRRITEETPDVKVIYPMHPNPAVRRAAEETLQGCPRIRLTEPLAAPAFHGLMARAYFVLTDSGGVQEEAAVMGKPVLVARDRTDRPEGVAAGAQLLVGTEEERVYRACRLLLEDRAQYARMCRAGGQLYGAGGACARIADIVERAEYCAPAGSMI